jgi:hypothetical protein
MTDGNESADSQPGEREGTSQTPAPVAALPWPLAGFEDLLEEPAEAGDEPASVRVDDRPDPSSSGSRPRRFRVALGLAVLGVVLVGAGALAGLLLAPDGDAEVVPQESAAVVKPQLELGSAGVFDSFARLSGPLGSSDSGQAWQEVSGSWGVANANALVTQPSAAGPSIAVVNMGTSDGVVQATMPNPERGAGLVFRFGSPLNHWTLTAAPGSATWVVTRTEGGEAEIVATLGTTPAGENVTIAVRFMGDEMAFFVDGVLRAELSDDFLLEASRVGLITRGQFANATWTNFVAVAQSE